MKQKIYKYLGLVLFIFCLSSMQAQDRPNIIWLMAEDIAPDLECYGMQAVKTPNLNKLSETGLKFTNAYCTNSICSPSRSAMMTGVHQNKINAQHHRSNRDVPLTKEVQPFTYHLREAGYTCILGHHGVRDKGRKTDVNFKSWRLGPWDGKKNFGLFDKLDTFTVADQPFFAQIQLETTHRGDWWDEVREASSHPVNPDEVVLPPYMADDPAIRLDWAKYLDQMEFIDNEVGMIIQELKEKGMYENTVIIFIGDNGRCNVFGKGYLHDPGLHIPLIVNWPGGIKQPKVREDLVTTTDITATILDYARVKVPDYMTGQSFIDEDFNREYVYGARDLWDEVMDKSRSLYDGQYKYIRNDMFWVPWDAHQAYLEFYRPAVHMMRKLKFEKKLNESEAIFLSPQKPREELYDMANDPNELNNLVNDPKYSQVLEKLRKDCCRIDKENTSEDHTFHPVVPAALNILDWVKLNYSEEYFKMISEGKEIGFQKYGGMYRKIYNSKKK